MAEAVSTGRTLRAFVACLATETNTFGALRADRRDFEGMFYARPGTHPAKPTLFTAPMIAAREAAAGGAFALTEGTATWAEPSGLVRRDAYESLRDEVLGQLQAASPVDIVLLGLHGAMVADGIDSCETDLVTRARRICGPDVVIGVELDMHCHLTPALADAATLLVLFKENPHTDFLERGRDLVRLCLAAAHGQVRPVASLFDCRSLVQGSYQTYRDPGRSFVNRLLALEGADGVLSISVAHGFQAADVPEAGVKVLVYTDQAKVRGDALARRLGQEILQFQDAEGVMLPASEAVAVAAGWPAGPVVLADRWDSPGGGVPGDHTGLLRELLLRPSVPSALGALWDPVAVSICRAAGPGAVLPLRIGGKAAAGSGLPVDTLVRVRAVTDNLVTPFQDSLWRMGEAACVTVGQVDIVLNARRTQTLHRDTFRLLGVDPAQKQIVVVKSSNHFFADFSKVAAHTIYVDSGGPWPHDPLRTPYARLRRPIAPLDRVEWS